MSDKSNQDKPSMEDILASIRRIIADDAQTSAMGASEVLKDAPERKHSADTTSTNAQGFNINKDPLLETKTNERKSDSAILELTEEVDAEGNLLLDSKLLKEEHLDNNVENVSTRDPEEELSALVENSTEGLIAEALASLAMEVRSGRVDADSSRISPGGRTIEDHVTEMLRPMLSEWLEKNLPHLVQRLVQREIDRIINRSDLV